ncbi:MAG: hypothetical protein ACJ76Z_15730 [Thermoleophilaceae bacterium]
MSEQRSRAAELAASQVETIVDAAEKAAIETRRHAEQQAREILDEARKVGRRELDDSRRKALQLGEDARKEAATAVNEAREAADAVMAEAESLAASLKAAATALTAEAERLVRDVQLTHRELLGELRLPGLAQRDAEKPRAERDLPFEVPDWLGGET